MNIEDTFLVDCGRGHSYAMVVGEDPTEYPCPFCTDLMTLHNKLNSLWRITDKEFD
jgi:hypothetical protein